MEGECGGGRRGKLVVVDHFRLRFGEMPCWNCRRFDESK